MQICKSTQSSRLHTLCGTFETFRPSIRRHRQHGRHSQILESCPPRHIMGFRLGLYLLQYRPSYQDIQRRVKYSAPPFQLNCSSVPPSASVDGGRTPCRSSLLTPSKMGDKHNSSNHQTPSSLATRRECHRIVHHKTTSIRSHIGTNIVK